MGAHDFRLGVDFGTSNTVAMLRWPDGRVRPLLFDGSPLLPSAVFAGPDGRIAVGRNAVHAGRAHPERFEPYPKRCVDDGTVLLGYAGTSAEPVAVPVEELITAVLRRVAEEATRTAGRPVPNVVLTFPAGWRQTRRNILLGAAGAAFPSVTLVPEPVAAASHFVTLEGAAVPSGSCVMVYDLGAGTFDASVVRRTGDGFEVLNTEGLSDAGGLDVDAAMMAYVGALYAARDAVAWGRLAEPAAPADRRLNRSLWDDIRVGKEILSYSTNVLVHVPLFDDDVPFGREQVEQLAQPIIARTVAVARSTLRGAGVDAADLTGLYLVGGASRFPLVATMLHRAFGVAPTTIEQPELAVAEGSLHAAVGPAARLDVPLGLATAGDPTGADGPAPAGGVALAGGAVPAGSPGAGAGPVAGDSAGAAGNSGAAGGVATLDQPAAGESDAARRRTRNRRMAIGAAFVTVAAILATLPFLGIGADDDPATDPGTGLGGALVGPTTTPPTSPTPAPTPSSAIDGCLIGTWRETSNTVDFTFNGLLVPMKAKGAIHRYWPNGRSRTDFGKGTTWTGRLHGRRYDVVTSGTLQSTLRTSSGRMFGRNTKASGTTIGKINGRESWREALRSAPGASDYDCAGDILTISLEPRDVEMQRVSRDPDAKV